MRRRQLIATGATAGVLAAPAMAQDTIKWSMVMPWPRNTPGVGTNAERFAKRFGTSVSTGIAQGLGQVDVK